MGLVVRTLIVGLAAATVAKVILAVTAADDTPARFFGYRLGGTLSATDLQPVRDETLDRQHLQVFQGRHLVEGMVVRASVLVLNGRIASVGLTVRPDDAGRMQGVLERRLGQAHTVTAAHGYPYRTWTVGDLSIGYGFSPADRQYAVTANLGDLRHFQP